MAKIPLNKEGEFVVGEEKVLVYILAFLFFGLFVYGLGDMILSGFKDIGYLDFVFIAALIPAFIFFRKGRSNRIYLRVNKTGIYQDGQLITGWADFLNAYITQKETAITIQDNFMLVIEFTKPGAAKGFRRKISLTNTQNKSEEEVLAAIKFFWNESRRSN
ncbi:MAG: hypothetical protein ABIR30_05450 [Chitinophagaceae bacterium]